MSQSQSTKKSVWKRWWLWVIVGLLILAVIVGCNGNDEEVVDEPEEVAEEPDEEPDKVDEEEKEPTLTGEEVDEIAEHLEVMMEEGESIILEERVHDTHIFKLEKIEFDADANQLNFTVDYQSKEPDGEMLPADVLKWLNKTWAHAAAENIPGISRLDFDIRVKAWTVVEDTDDILDWGTTHYRDNEYTFSEGTHFDMLQ